MNILSPFRKPELHVEQGFTEAGVRFRLQYRDEGGVRTVRLPLADQELPMGRRQPHAVFQALLLEGLYYDDVLIETNDGAYIIPYSYIYDEIGTDMADALDIPRVANVQVSLQARTFVAASSFRIEATIRHPEFGLLPVHRRIGPIVPVGETHILLTDAARRLLDTVENPPANQSEQMAYVAKVKKLAQEAGAQLDGYLTSEEYIFAEQLGLSASLQPDGSISLEPVLEDLPPEHAHVRDKALATGYAAVTGSQGSRVRIFPSAEVRRRAEQIKKVGPITGEDIPEFVENPIPFLSEEWDAWNIDLELFSKRVKGLGIRTYTSKPYVTARRDGRGWFEIDVGLQVTDSSIDDADTPSFRADDELERKITDAQKKGKRWVQHNGDWIRVPPGNVTVPEIRERIGKVTAGQAMPPERFGFVLEIFDNIEHLEYSETLLDIINTVTGGTTDIAPPPNPPFELSLHPHQLEGYRWLHGRRRHRLGGLLADDMGLGKTIQVLALAASLAVQDELRPSIIVVPRSLVDNWQEEIFRAAPSIRTYQHVGGGRLRDPEHIARFDLVLTTYETLVRDQLILGQIDWELVVCDEAQYIRNYTTSRASAVKALKARTRLALTGTPVENKLGDLWSIVDFAQPGLLGSYSEFRERYEKPLELGQDDAETVERRLLTNIAPVYLRRTKDDHVSLPPKEVHRYLVPLSDEQRRMYIGVIDGYHKMESKGGQALGAIQRLIQICSHPYMLDSFRASTESVERLIAASPKLAKTVEILSDVQWAGEKAVVFTHYRFMQAILQRTIYERFGVRPHVINGESPQRVQTVRQFNDSPGFNVLILSTRAAGVGLNVTGANHVIHYTRWWNPAQEKQATDRVHRIGQQKPVHVHFPIVVDPIGQFTTAEERLDELLQEKERLAKSIVVPSSSLTVTAEELEKVLSV